MQGSETIRYLVTAALIVWYLRPDRIPMSRASHATGTTQESEARYRAVVTRRRKASC